MMSRVILVAMLPPSGATRCDLLAMMVETKLRTGTSNLARILFSWPLVIWTPARGVVRGGDDGDALLSQLTYAVPWVAASLTGCAGVLNGGHRTLTDQVIVDGLYAAAGRAAAPVAGGE